MSHCVSDSELKSPFSFYLTKAADQQFRCNFKKVQETPECSRNCVRAERQLGVNCVPCVNLPFSSQELHTFLTHILVCAERAACEILTVSVQFITFYFDFLCVKVF